MIGSIPARALAAATLALALVGGCSSGGAPQSGAARSPSPSTSAATRTPGPSGSPSGSSASPAAVARPRAGACYELTVDELTRPTNDSPAVSCRTSHDAVTIYVGRLREVVDGHALAVDSDRVQRQVATACPRRLARYVGGSREVRRLSRINVAWFSPSLEQSDRGATWFRCDLVVFARQDTLLRLPPAGQLRHALNARGALSRWGLCGTAAPATRRFSRVICSLPHRWKAIATIRLSGGSSYPGTAAVRRAGDSVCKARVRAQARNRLSFRYGWEWPTAEQWRGGRHFGYCWAPA